MSPCSVWGCSRAQKNECSPYQELAKLCGQDKGVAELTAFAQSKQADFEAVSCGFAGVQAFRKSCCKTTHVQCELCAEQIALMHSKLY